MIFNEMDVSRKKELTQGSNLRIALVYLGRRGSGGPISYQLANGLAKHSQVLAVLSAQVQDISVWKESRLELLLSPTYSTTIQALISWLNPAPIYRLADQIRAWKPDVLVFPMFYTWNPILQRCLSEIPSIVWVHDPLPHPGLIGQIYRRMEDTSIRQAQQCVILSPGFEETMLKRGARPGRVTFLPHGDLSFYLRYQDDAITLPENENTIVLFFGRIDAYKGLDVLLSAWESLENQLGSRLRSSLRIVGSGSLTPYQPLLKRLQHVEVINRWVNDSEIPHLFRGVKIVVIPYTSASQSGVIPLAAAFGVPVIASRVGGIPDQIKDGETGVLIEPGSPSKLADAILSLIENPDAAIRIGSNLKNDYANERSWEAVSSHLYQICHQALNV